MSRQSVDTVSLGMPELPPPSLAKRRVTRQILSLIHI